MLADEPTFLNVPLVVLQMDITFLGTGCMKPTKERNPSSILLEYKGEGILFDCGEGTQRQFSLCGLKPTKITRILLSHWHGDHVLGLAGLIATIVQSEYTGTLHVYGPPETSSRMADWFRAVPFDCNIDLKVHEITKGGVFLDTPDFTIEAQNLKHRMPCIGFAFHEKDRRRMREDVLKKLGIPQGPLWGKLQDGKTIEWQGNKITPDQVTVVVKGKRIAYITDTLPTENCVILAQDADLLICEAPHAADLRDKAQEYMHLTAEDAGLIASRANVHKLILQHISPRYKNAQQIEEDCRKVFDNTTIAHDFTRITL